MKGTMISIGLNIITLTLIGLLLPETKISVYLLIGLGWGLVGSGINLMSKK